MALGLSSIVSFPNTAVPLPRVGDAAYSQAGDWRSAFIVFAGDSSYPTGGTVIYANAGNAPPNATVLGVSAINTLICVGCTSGYLAAIVQNAAGQPVLKVYQQPATAAAGPSPEVPNATNLSGVSFYCIATVKC